MGDAIDGSSHSRSAGKGNSIGDGKLVSFTSIRTQGIITANGADEVVETGAGAAVEHRLLKMQGWESQMAISIAHDKTTIVKRISLHFPLVPYVYMLALLS
eukprot:scaffold3223_cov161-Skeletonema_marinoi.AAC.2